MFKNCLAAALRNFARQKLYSFINVAGLTIGLSCAILIGLYVKQELSFDRWLPNADRLYRISISLGVPGQPAEDFGAASAPLPMAMTAEIPGVLEQTRLSSQDSTIKVADRPYLEWINAVDANFFTVFRLPFVAGDPTRALSRPDGVVLSQSAARKYFGSIDPMGRTMRFDGKTTRTVTGILRDLPYNTQFTGDVFVLYRVPAVATLPDGHPDPKEGIDPYRWTLFNTSAYVRLAPNVDPKTVAAQIPQLFLRHMSPSMIAEAKAVLHASVDQLIRARLVPLDRVHFENTVKGGGMKPATSPITVYGIAAVAILILMIAGFNFTNIEMARSSLRAREVGLRKTVGASRRQLMTQFLTQSVLTALLALVLALAIVEILLPAYSDFLGHEIVLNYGSDWPFVLFLVVATVAVGMLGGLYPALVLSKFHPATVLHRRTAGSAKAGGLRTILVVLQFSASIGLGIAALVVFAQTKYARALDLGFSKENVVAISIYNSGLSDQAKGNLRQSLADIPGVKAAAMSSKLPADQNQNMNIAKVPGSTRSISTQVICASPEFFSVYGIRLAAGRFLSRARGIDVHYPGGNTGEGSGIYENGKSIMIDEAAARALGYTPTEAVGKTIDIMGGHVTIVGVIRNVLFAGAKAVSIMPTIYYFRPNEFYAVSLKIERGRTAQAIPEIDRIWNRYAPEKPITRWFIEDSINYLYADADRQGTVMNICVGIAIFIACLGLFGLAAFTVQRRTKEIGIRKVFGASTTSIVWLLLWQFSIPILIANLIAWPLAYLYLHHWLESYAYRIALSPLYFIAAGLTALVIAWATVAAHTIRVAKQSAITALKYE